MNQPSGELIREQIMQTVMQARPCISERAAIILPGFDVAQAGRRLDDLVRRMEQPLRIGIIGEFRVGKSSLVNALAQARIAFTDEVEATATLNRYYYSDSEHANVIYTDKRVERMSIADVLSLLDEKRYDTEWLHTVQQVAIGYPVPFLREMELWDTPGLGGSDFNTQLAQQFSQELDAVIWVFDVSTLGKQDTGRVLTEIDAHRKLTIGVINKSENLATQEAKRARNFIREVYPHVNFVDILPFSAVLALHSCGLLDEEPLAFGDALPPDGGREQLLQLIRQHVLQDPHRVATQAVLADCIAVLDEIADELHVNLLYRQRQLARYEQAIGKGRYTLTTRFQELQSELEQTVERGLRHYLYQQLHEEIEQNSQKLRDGRTFTRLMQKILDAENIQRYVQSLIHQQEPRIRSVIQETGVECDRAVERLLTPVERIEVQRQGIETAPAPSTVPAVATPTDDTPLVATSVAALFALVLHPPLWAVPIAWAASALLYRSARGRTADDIISERRREGERTIDGVLHNTILPQVSRAIEAKLRDISQEIESHLHVFWRQQLLGGDTPEQVQSVCAHLHNIYQQFRQWLNRLYPLYSATTSGSTAHRAGRVTVTDKQTVRTLLEAILDEARRNLWVLDVHLDPQVVQWLENAHPSASLRILTAESHLDEASVILFEQAIRTLRQQRQGAVNMGILRDTHLTAQPDEPPFCGSWLYTDRGCYYFSIPLVEVLRASRDFDFEPVTSDTLPPRRVTADTFEKWWFNRDKNLQMLPVFLREHAENQQQT